MQRGHYRSGRCQHRRHHGILCTYVHVRTYTYTYHWYMCTRVPIGTNGTMVRIMVVLEYHWYVHGSTRVPNGSRVYHSSVYVQIYSTRIFNTYTLIITLFIRQHRIRHIHEKPIILPCQSRNTAVLIEPSIWHTAIQYRIGYLCTIGMAIWQYGILPDPIISVLPLDIQTLIQYPKFG